jgi:hypothetical protein
LGLLQEHALNLKVCPAVMTLVVNPFDRANMTYNQASALVETAYRSVMHHETPFAAAVTIPDQY